MYRFYLHQQHISMLVYLAYFYVGVCTGFTYTSIIILAYVGVGGMCRFYLHLQHRYILVYVVICWLYLHLHKFMLV